MSNEEEPLEDLRERMLDLVLYYTEPEPEEYVEVIDDLLSLFTRDQLLRVESWYPEDLEYEDEV